MLTGLKYVKGKPVDLLAGRGKNVFVLEACKFFPTAKDAFAYNLDFMKVASSS